MLDHMILTVSDVERSLAFYKADLSKGSPIRRLFIGGSWQKMKRRLMNSTKPQWPRAPGTTFRPAHDWNTIRDTTPLMYSTQTDIHSSSSIRANSAQRFTRANVTRCYA